jgi:hypothetical protein
MSEEMPVSRRIVTADEFDRALVALESPAAARLAGMLARYLAGTPEREPLVDGVGVRLLQCRAYGEYPALRLFYGYNDDALYLLHVEVFDELAEMEEEEGFPEAELSRVRPGNST